MAASVVASLVFPVVYRGSLSYFLPSSTSLEATDSLVWLLFEVSAVAALVAALLIGYLFRRRFQYPLRDIFLTSAVVSFLVVAAVWLVTAVPVLGSLQTPDSALPLAYLLVTTVILGMILAALVTAGAAIRQRIR